jgi:hypothetical protein
MVVALSVPVLLLPTFIVVAETSLIAHEKITTQLTKISNIFSEFELFSTVFKLISPHFISFRDYFLI